MSLHSRFSRIPVGFAFLLALMFLPSIVLGQNNDTPKSQDWMGTLDTGLGKLRLKLAIAKDGDSYSAVMYSVDQGNAKMALDSFSLQDGVVKFAAKKFQMSYEGKVTDDGDSITGKFTQLGRTFALNFEKTSADAKWKHTESWTGLMKAGAQEFDFQIRIFESEAGKLKGKLDSFSESVFDLPIDYSMNDGVMEFKVLISNATYKGTRSDNGNEVSGHWMQRGNKLALNFKKIAIKETRKPVPPRPQTPKAPFPYDSKDVSYDNKKDKVKLAGTLTTPKGKGPFPAVILISGSGAQDRDSTIFHHKSFFVIADALTRKGVAVLRYDERGVGKSSGDIGSANSLDLARDVEAGIAFLKQHEKIDAGKIGLIGHSEGGYIAPMIAARNKSVAYIVMMAGPGVPGKQIVLNQSRLIMEAMGLKKEDIDQNVGFSKALLGVLEEKPPVGELKERLEKRFDSYLATLPDDVQKKLGDLSEQKQSISQMSSNWFLFFANHDPRNDLRKVKCPVLVINGTKDLQVDPDLNLPEIEKALKQAKNEDVTIKRLENLNHLFQKSKTGRVDEYAKLTETFNKDALKLIVDWVREKTR